MSTIKVKGFIISKPKISHCEDCMAANTTKGRFAVADGLTNSIYSDIVSKLLCKFFVNEDIPLQEWPDIFEKTILPSISKKWVILDQEREKELDKQLRTPWHKKRHQRHRNGLPTGATTFAGIEIDKENRKIHYLIMGDSTLFFINTDGSYFAINSGQKSEEKGNLLNFNNKPNCIVVEGLGKPQKIYGEWETGSFDIENGYVILMTDGCAEWFQGAYANDPKTLESLWNLPNNEAFAKLADFERTQNGKMDDDLAVIILKINDDSQIEDTPSEQQQFVQTGITNDGTTDTDEVSEEKEEDKVDNHDADMPTNTPEPSVVEEAEVNTTQNGKTEELDEENKEEVDKGEFQMENTPSEQQQSVQTGRTDDVTTDTDENSGEDDENKTKEENDGNKDKETVGNINTREEAREVIKKEDTIEENDKEEVNDEYFQLEYFPDNQPQAIFIDRFGNLITGIDEDSDKKTGNENLDVTDSNQEKDTVGRTIDEVGKESIVEETKEQKDINVEENKDDKDKQTCIKVLEKCPSCGHFISIGSNYCPHCGNHIEKCPSCGHRISKESNNCPHCGWPINTTKQQQTSLKPSDNSNTVLPKIHCNVCGTQFDTKRCPNCGTPRPNSTPREQIIKTPLNPIVGLVEIKSQQLKIDSDLSQKENMEQEVIVPKIQTNEQPPVNQKDDTNVLSPIAEENVQAPTDDTQKESQIDSKASERGNKKEQPCSNLEKGPNGENLRPNSTLKKQIKNPETKPQQLMIDFDQTPEKNEEQEVIDNMPVEDVHKDVPIESTHNIKTTPTETNTFFIFRALYLENKKWVKGNTQVKVGDEVIICGKLVNYKGNTPETVANKSYIYSLNSKATDNGDYLEPDPQQSTATGSGTLTDPWNAVAAQNFTSSLPADTPTEEDYYIKGKIARITQKGKFDKRFGNATFYISDNGANADRQGSPIQEIQKSEGPLVIQKDEQHILSPIVEENVQARPISAAK